MFDLALATALDVLNRYGLEDDQLVEQAGLDPGRAARLTLEGGSALLKGLDDSRRELVRRLVGEYYRILLSHRDAILQLGLPALRALLAGMEPVRRRLEELLTADQRRAWARAKWPLRSYNSDWGLQPPVLRPEY